MKEISLDSKIMKKVHSIQLSGVRFVVSHGDSESLNRVCIVDTSEGIIQCYGGAIADQVLDS